MLLQKMNLYFSCIAEKKFLCAPLYFSQRKVLSKVLRVAMHSATRSSTTEVSSCYRSNGELRAAADAVFSALALHEIEDATNSHDEVPVLDSFRCSLAMYVLFGVHMSKESVERTFSTSPTNDAVGQPCSSSAVTRETFLEIVLSGSMPYFVLDADPSRTLWEALDSKCKGYLTPAMVRNAAEEAICIEPGTSMLHKEDVDLAVQVCAALDDDGDGRATGSDVRRALRCVARFH